MNFSRYCASSNYPWSSAISFLSRTQIHTPELKHIPYHRIPSPRIFPSYLHAFGRKLSSYYKTGIVNDLCRICRKHETRSNIWDHWNSTLLQVFCLDLEMNVSGDSSDSITKNELLYFSGSVFRPKNEYFENNAIMYGTFAMQGIGVVINSYLVSSFWYLHYSLYKSQICILNLHVI